MSINRNIGFTSCLRGKLDKYNHFTFIFIVNDEGKTNGLNDKDRGHIGVNSIDDTKGCTIGPPADNEYAVDPVGVETINPSAYDKFYELTTASVK